MRKVLRTGLVPARAWRGKAVGIAPTERLKIEEADGSSSSSRQERVSVTLVVSYKRERPVGAIVFEPETLPGVLEVFCDADHAGDLGTRKSRSGTAFMWGTHLIKHGSAVQSTIALSSGESENFALLRSSAHALGIKAMLNDWHHGVKCARAPPSQRKKPRNPTISRKPNSQQHPGSMKQWGR